MLGTYALSAGYYDAYYLKAQKVRTLIKGDFDALWAQGFDALVAPTSPTVAFPFGAKTRRPGRDVPLGRLHAAGQHGRAAGHLDPVPACPRACRSVSSSSARRGRSSRCSSWPVATRRSRPTADWRRLEPADLAALDDPSTPTPAERVAALPLLSSGLYGERRRGTIIAAGPIRRERASHARIAGRHEEGAMLRGFKPVALGFAIVLASGGVLKRWRGRQRRTRGQRRRRRGRRDICTAPPKHEGTTLTFASFGGVYQEAQREGWLEPYTALTGVQFTESEESSNATIKAQVEAGNVEWDVVDVGNDFGLDGERRPARAARLLARSSRTRSSTGSRPSTASAT